MFLCPAAKHNEDSRRARERGDVCPNTQTAKGTRALQIACRYALTHTHLSARWTLIRMQSGGIMWFKQSRSWQNRSPTELKIKPNTFRDQITGPYVDLA